jgi:BMFP domain-containing protein YqiC
MPNKTFVEDMLALGSSVLSNLSDARHELKTQARQHVGSVAHGLDLVSRQEFDAAFAMVARARNMQEDLSARLARIEDYLNLSSRKAPGKNKVKTKKRNLPSVKKRKTRRAEK